jgi:glutamyl-tRNA synthetase
MKTRFCPSPTGNMHLGNARTALFNALFAKSQSGSFLLRIEDTDAARSHEDYDAGLQYDLRWLGLEWQEGPEVGGAQEPYYQSQRQAIYNRYYQQLQDAKLVYPCFCSDQQLAISRKVQLASGQPPRYSGTCRHLTAEQIAEKQAEGLKPVLRFEVPANESIEFHDLVRGQQSFNSRDIGDFIVRRADSTASFIFCNALDDALMGVTHALRGDDHLANTPRQLLILKALNLSAPHYGHIALIMGSDGSPLSKRHGSRSIKELREEGFLPIAIVNYLSRLGHYYTETGFMDFETLAARFDSTAMGAAPSRFDASQLLHWQKEAVAQTSNEALWEWMGMGNDVHARVPEEKRELFINIVRHNVVFPRDALHWATILFATQLDYTEEAKAVLQTAGSAFFQAAVDLINEVGSNFKELTTRLQAQSGLKGKALYQPLRVALTGELSGPEMPLVVELLGAEGMRTRLNHHAASL